MGFYKQREIPVNEKQTDPMRRILLVDDNEAIHGDFRKVLAPDIVDLQDREEEAALFGESVHKADDIRFDLDSAHQGEEALEMLRKSWAEERPYALAFVDVRMPPGWNGIETITRLWEFDPFLHIVICTAYSDFEWQEIVTKLGRNDRTLVLKKPFDNIEAGQLALTLTEKWAMGLQEWCKLRDAKQDASAAKRELKVTRQQLAHARKLVADRAEEIGRRRHDQVSDIVEDSCREIRDASTNQRKSVKDS